jgi:hypothetical protein
VGDCGGKAIECAVDSLEKVGDAYYLFCSVNEDQKVMLKSPKRLGIGESTSFTIDRCNV